MSTENNLEFQANISIYSDHNYVKYYNDTVLFKYSPCIRITINNCNGIVLVFAGKMKNTF